MNDFDDRQLDDLLRRATRRQTPAPELIESVRDTLDARRRRAAWRAPLAAAAMLLIGITAWMLLRPAPPTPQPHDTEIAQDVPTDDEVPAVAEVEPGAGLIAQHVETTHPNVTIVLFYDEITPSPVERTDDADERNET